MRGKGALRAVAGLGLAAAVSWGPGAPAEAGEIVRVGWWSVLEPAVAAPDAPEDGLHAAGGPDGPSALAAIAFELPASQRAAVLSLQLAGTAPRAEGLQACAIAEEDAGFEPSSGGAWDARPAYDCEQLALAAEVDGSTVVIDLAALGDERSAALALVPGQMTRASFEQPALGVTAVPGAPAEMQAEPTPSPEPEPSFTSPAPAPFDLAPPPTAPVSPPVVAAEPFDEPAQELGSAPVVAATTEVDRGGQSWRTSVGGALGFALLLAALLFYSQGRGVLGARVGA